MSVTQYERDGRALLASVKVPGAARILRCLRFDAERWWGFKGDRPAQRKSIREGVKCLRAAIDCHGYVHFGRGGATLHYQAPKLRGCTVGHSAGCHPGKGLAARLLLPWVDTTTVPEEHIFNVAMNLPMIHPDTREQATRMLDRDAAARMAPALGGAFRDMAEKATSEPKWSGLDTVPLAVYCELAAPYGATFGGLQ